MEASKKGFLFLIFGIALSFLSFFPWDMLLPPWQCWQYRDWKIDSRAEGFFQSDLVWGATIQGQVWCYGGDNGIDFLITDSGSNVCLNPGRIYDGYRFKWHAPYNDIYSFKFGNTSSESSRNVGYLISSYYYMHVFLTIGVILVAIGLLVILKEAMKTVSASPERKSEQPSPVLIEEESKESIKALQKETEDLKSAVRDLQATIVELLERTREPKSD